MERGWRAAAGCSSAEETRRSPGLPAQGFTRLGGLAQVAGMARGKGNTPRRNNPAAAHLDDDYSPSSPSPSPAAPSPSRRTPLQGSPARLNTPTAAPGLPDKPQRGPTPLAQETTYHSRTRQLLVEHRKLRRQFTELVIRGLVGRTKAALELWVDVECVHSSYPSLLSRTLAHAPRLGCRLALKAIDKQTRGGDKAAASSAVRAGYLFAQSAKLSDQVAAVEAVFTSLVRAPCPFPLHPCPAPDTLTCRPRSRRACRS